MPWMLAAALLVTTALAQVPPAQPQDIFIIAGQSNAAGWSRERNASKRADVFSGALVEGGRLRWRPCADPQTRPGGGSWVPLLGDRWARAAGRSVGFLNVAVGSSGIRDWQPGRRAWRTLVTALRAVDPTRLRAVLWQQGESDQKMPAHQYAQYLERLMESSTQASGRTVPWIVARASYVYGKPAPNIRAAQQTIIDRGRALPGPDADALGEAFRERDNLHFNARGNEKLAALWFEALQRQLPAPTR